LTSAGIVDKTRDFAIGLFKVPQILSIRIRNREALMGTQGAEKKDFTGHLLLSCQALNGAELVDIEDER
jgi:hypothetical protein